MGKPKDEQYYAIKREQHRRKCLGKGGFRYFVRNIFSASFPLGEFVWGDYLEDVCTRMEEHKWTMDISARDHFKSTRLYAEIMYDIFTMDKDIECHYFSYQQGMSGYHLQKVIRLMESNPYFSDKWFENLAPMSLSVIRMRNRMSGAVYEAKPEGLLSFKRGIHAERIYIDDPLKDPENKLAPTVIYKINGIIKMEMFAMVKKGGYCRVVGTPQTNNDFFFDEQLRNKFFVTIKPAIVDEKKQIVIFPEWKSYQELDDIRNTIGEKAFNQEYMTKPAYAENSYIDRKDLLAVTNPDLEEVSEYTGGHDVVAGFDIGKKAHPSHLTVFERTYDPEIQNYRYRQLHSKFIDGMDYKDQIELLKDVVERYRIDKLRYDNTRAEFELFAEQGLLPDCMEPIVLTMKQNNAMGANFNKVIQEKRVEFIDEPRQIDQILQVNNDLQAIESPMGHGDSFWSNAMALMEEPERQYRVRPL